MASFSRIIMSMSIILALFSCKQPTDTKGIKGGEPLPPPYLDMNLAFERLPDVQQLAKLVYDITFVGKDGLPLTTLEGDTVDYLWLYFEMDQKTELLNANADSVWHGRVGISQSIHLEFEFQIIDAIGDNCCNTDIVACHKIMLVGAFFTIKHTLATLDVQKIMGSSVFTVADLYFNHRTGGYIFSNPYEVYQGGP